MKMLSVEELNELRKNIAGSCRSDDAKNELILSLDAIITSFIDQAYGRNPTQISLSQRANYAFKGGINSDRNQNIAQHDIAEISNADATNPISAIEDFAP